MTEPTGTTRPRLSLTEALDLRREAHAAQNVHTVGYYMCCIGLVTISLCYAVALNLIHDLTPTVPWILITLLSGSVVFFVGGIMVLMYASARKAMLVAPYFIEAKEVIDAAKRADDKIIAQQNRQPTAD